MRVAVLQPSYLPWVGVFALIDMVDIYVFYDDVQFEAQSWQQRNRIRTVDRILWLTVPVERHFGQKINEVKINYEAMDWRNKHLSTIRQSYAKSPFLEDYATFWVEFYGTRFVYLSDMNMYLTQCMTDGFNLRVPKFVKSSQYELEGTKTDRLICLLKQLKATEYISGVAAKSYVEENKFKENNIKLTWFEYQPAEYPQIHGTFVPYLSSIDLLANCGEESKEIIRRGKISTTIP